MSTVAAQRAAATAQRLLVRAATSRWLVALALVVAAYLKTVRTADVSIEDSVWQTQVTDRVAHGDVLYRDVFFGAPPLSVYLVAPLVLAFGPHAIFVVAAAIACLVGSALLALRIAGQLGVRRPWLLLPALVIWVGPPANLYQPLAFVAALGCFTLTLDWLDRRRKGGPGTALLAAAGGAAGIATAAKQTTGLLALVALALAIALERGGLRSVVRRAGVALAAFAVPVAAAVTSIVALGAWSEFVDYVLVKRNYVGASRGITGSGPTSLVDFVEHPSLLNAGAVYTGTEFLLLVAAAALIVVALRARSGDRRITVAALFAAGSAATLYPWPAVLRVQWILPAILPLAAVGLQSLRREGRAARVGAYALGLYLLLGLVPLVVAPVARLASGRRALSRLPTLEGMAVAPDDEAVLQRNAAELSAAARGGKLLLAGEGASVYYLTARVENPTPFDYMWVTTFGSHGERDTIERLRSGDLRTVCVGPFRNERRLRPQRLLRYIRTSMRPGRRVGPCVLYTRR